MSVLNPGAGDLFTVRLYKKMDVAADQMWANTYELKAGASPSYETLLDAVEKLVAFEKLIHHDTVHFDRAVVSTYVPDGRPYAPESFASLPQSGQGNISSPLTQQVLPLQVVLFVRRDVPSGRTGKAFYRGCLGEDDVNGRYGTINLTAPATVQARIAGAVTSAGIDELLGGGEAFNYRLVMAGSLAGGAVHSREITALTAVSAKIVKYNNRYFDRA